LTCKLLQEGALARLDGVVPSSSGIIQAPCLVAAFDASSFLQQQQQQQQQQQATACRNAPASPMAGKPDQLLQQHDQQQRRQQQQLQHATTGSSSSSSIQHKQVLHTISYQTVSTVFLWRLPVKQLALALAAQPGLLQNLAAELAACNAPTE
jgi:hypothetical protein